MPEARFEVYSIESKESHVVITGRCVGGEVRIGTLFSRVDPQGDSISFRVMAIESYRHKIEAVQSGMSAALHGDGPTYPLKQWDVLASTDW